MSWVPSGPDPGEAKGQTASWSGRWGFEGCCTVGESWMASGRWHWADLSRSDRVWLARCGHWLHSLCLCHLGHLRALRLGGGPRVWLGRAARDMVGRCSSHRCPEGVATGGQVSRLHPHPGIPFMPTAALPPATTSPQTLQPSGRAAVAGQGLGWDELGPGVPMRCQEEPGQAPGTLLGMSTPSGNHLRHCALGRWGP